ncbi:MAG: TadE/TadG family type IV pilus assembly protein [Hyphomicrobiales bacterium]
MIDGRLLSAFRSSTAGNVGVMFALALVPLIWAAGAAIDYHRATNAKQELQSALDAGALAAGALKTTDQKVAFDVVDRYLKSNLPAEDYGKVQGLTVTVAADGKVSATANSHEESSLLAAVGVSDMPFTARTEVVRSKGNPLELALVLDNTGSMAGQKIADLKSAATDLVNTVMIPDVDVKISVVPFAQYVNVGTANRNQPWMSVPPDSKTSTTTYQCTQVRDVLSTTNCVTKPVVQTSCNDGVCTSKTVNQTSCQYTYGPYYQKCGNVTTTNTQVWNGCAGSRAYPLNVRDEAPSTPYPGIMNVSCPSVVTPLSKDKPTVTAALSKMVTTGETYIPAGLMWGWTTLSADAPYTEAVPYSNKQVKKALVLMTDGANTKSLSALTGYTGMPDHKGSNVTQANTYTSELCTNIKASGITVYTIAFQVTDATIKTRLRDCASDPALAFTPDNASQLSSAFAEIADALKTLALYR